ncbi:MAG: glycosyltransferase family 2 protein [Polyangiaceae bacterium]
MTLSLIIPVYKNEGSLPELLEQLEGLSRSLPVPLETVFVVDGSPDGSFAYLRANLPKASFDAQLHLHSRNFGSFAAIRTGLAAGRGEFLAVIAADLQEPPSLIENFHAALAKGEHDIAVGRRESREDSFLSTLASDTFWSLYRRLVMPAVPKGGVDLFACTRTCRDQLLKLSESNSSLVGLLFWIGFRRVEVPYARLKRRHGRSAWSLSKKIQYLLDSVYAFSDLPVKLLVAFGSVATLFAMVLAVLVVTARLLGQIPVAGYTVVVLLVMFFGGLNLLSLGIVGGYVWRTFENSKSRPIAIVMSSERFLREGTS